MVIVKIVFPAAKRAGKTIVYEVRLKGSASDISFDHFKGKLMDLSRTKKGKYFISWHATDVPLLIGEKVAIHHAVVIEINDAPADIDGTEYCTISTTGSLRDALATMERNSNSLPTIFVMPVVREGEELSAFYDTIDVTQLPTDFREHVNDIVEEDESLIIGADAHKDVELVCHTCGQRDWTGDKFTCVVCPKIVFCTKCFNDSLHPKHPMVVTRGSGPYPCPVLQAVKTVAKTITDYEPSSSESSDSESSFNDTTPTTTTTHHQHPTQPQPKQPHRTHSSMPQTQPMPQLDPKSRGFASSSCVPEERAEEVNELIYAEALRRLKEMGFADDGGRLSRLVAAENGEMSNIISKLTGS